MSMAGSRDKSSSPPDAPPGASPFAALGQLRGSLPPGTDPAPEEAGGATANPFAQKIVVRRERKGRGGKTVTVIRGIALQGEALARLAREMRQALGTGGGVEEGEIVLAGDQTTRAETWLRGRGATQVVIGN